MLTAYIVIVFTFLHKDDRECFIDNTLYIVLNGVTEAAEIGKSCRKNKNCCSYDGIGERQMFLEHDAKSCQEKQKTEA